MSKPNEPKQPTGDGLWTQDGCWILTGATSMTQVQNPGVANGLIHTHNSALRSLKADRPTCPSDEKDMSMCCPDYMQAYVTRVVEEREALRAERDVLKRQTETARDIIEHTQGARDSFLSQLRGLEKENDRLLAEASAHEDTDG